MSRILVVVPDSDLRKSMEFALAAEGHDVVWRASIGAKGIPDFDCTIVDHHALGADLGMAGAFCRSFYPVILLANSASHPLSPGVFRTLMKPLLGPALIQAIRDALDTRAITT